MERITNVANLLAEMDEIGEKMNHSGTEILSRNGSVRKQISRLLAIHRRMLKSSSSKTELATTSTQQEPQQPPTPSPTSTTNTPRSRLDSLQSFRSYLKSKLSDMGVTVQQAHALNSWEKSCKRVQNSVSVYIAGLGGHFGTERMEKLREDGKKLSVKAGGFLLRGKRGGGTGGGGEQQQGWRLPFFMITAIKKRKRELLESLQYLDQSPNRKSPLFDDTTSVRIPSPVNLTFDLQPTSSGGSSTDGNVLRGREIFAYPRRSANLSLTQKKRSSTYNKSK